MTRPRDVVLSAHASHKLARTEWHLERLATNRVLWKQPDAKHPCLKGWYVMMYQWLLLALVNEVAPELPSDAFTATARQAGT